MILYLKEDNQIICYRDIKNKQDAEKYLNDFGAIWFDGEFFFGMGEHIEGKEQKYFYEDGEIKIRYFDISQSEITQLDRIEEAVAKSQAEIAQEARDAYTLELIEGGVIA